MLVEDLGYRKPSNTELASLEQQGWFNTIAKRVSRTLAKEFVLPSAHLICDPFISYSGIVPRAPLAFASVAKGRFKDTRMWILASPTWTIAQPETIKKIRESAILHRARNPCHNIIFMCNSVDEVIALSEVGEAAIFHNKTSFVDDDTFKPLENVDVEFDAIYNAQLVKWKRHELCSEIDTCGYLYYRASYSQEYVEIERSIYQSIMKDCPKHTFINEFDSKERPIRLAPGSINQHLNRASVGLCLSETEGAMLASVEYMLAGLPVVSTPSTGGRDVFYDEEYCIIANPDPRSIAQAVESLKSRKFPREYIRKRTLERLNEHRAKFGRLIDDILSECGSDLRFSDEWPFKQTPTASWVKSKVAIERAQKSVTYDFGPKSAFINGKNVG